MSSRQVRRIGRPSFSRANPARAKSRSWPRLPRPKRLWWKVALLVLVAIGFWRYFAIERISLEGVTTLDQKAIELSVRKAMKSQLLGENLVTLNANRLEDFVIGEVPEIKDIKVKRKWPTLLILQIREREPSLAWKSAGVLYLLDKDGTVIREIAEAQGRIAVVIDNSNLPVKLGTKAVPGRFVSFTLEVVQGVGALGGGIKEMSVTDTTSELNVVVGEGYTVRLDTTRGAGDQIASLKAVLDGLGKQGKRPAEYVDLRVAGRAYYK